jgi:hypothetical protein
LAVLAPQFLQKLSFSLICVPQRVQNIDAVLQTGRALQWVDERLVLQSDYPMTVKGVNDRTKVC